MTQYTNEELFNKGMWNCLECGHINCIEDNKCDKCYQEKFIFREQNAPKKAKDFDLEPLRIQTVPLFNFHFKPRLMDMVTPIIRTNPYKNNKIDSQVI